MRCFTSASSFTSLISAYSIVPRLFSTLSMIPAGKFTNHHADYEEAVHALNALQSNASVLEKAKCNQGSINPAANLVHCKRLLQELGLTLNQLDNLNIIHVAGTKGKGTTCALTESFLRHQGLKTGFFSSPHLINVRERIRINGRPISPECFAKYFWKVYNLLHISEKQSDDEMVPAYFKYMTLMCFYVFVCEKVDVAIVEVGLGGAYDCTNIIRNPVVCAVTTLDLDHVSVLGNTIEEIAWQKAGIFKDGTVAVTVPQEGKALSVLCQRAAELNCNLYLAPILAEYANWHKGMLPGGMPTETIHWNASLALQLSRIWNQRVRQDRRLFDLKAQSFPIPYHTCSETFYDLNILHPFLISDTYQAGFGGFSWPGRYEIKRCGNLTSYIDGAHTPKSIQLCSKWFIDQSRNEYLSIRSPRCRNITRVLLFNCTSDRKPENLVPFLMDCNFDVAIFSPNTVHVENDSHSDLANLMVSRNVQMQRCVSNCQAFKKSLRKQLDAQVDLPEEVEPTDADFYCDVSHDSESNSDIIRNITNCITVVLPCLSDVSDMIAGNDGVVDRYCDNIELAIAHKKIIDSDHIQLLVTGSLHLAGAFISLTNQNI